MARSVSLSDQLRPIQSAVRQRFSNVEPIGQVTFRLPGKNFDKVFSDARAEILRWIGNRAGRPLPRAAWDGQSFDLHDVGAQRTAAIALEDPLYWAARLDDADRFVPQRTWTTEIGLARSAGNQILFGCRLICVTRGSNQPFEPTLPGVVRQIAERFGGYLDDVEISMEPHIISDEGSVDEIVELIENPSRRKPVVLLSLPDGETDIRLTAIPVNELCKATLGAAHIGIITGPSTFDLTDRIGQEFSVFWQGVRTYRPLFRSEADQPSDHPLARGDRIANWPGGPEEFRKFLVREIMRRTITDANTENDMPSFVTVQQLSLHQKRIKAKDEGVENDELVDMALAENANLIDAIKEQKEIYDGLLAVAETERKRSESERDEIKAQNAALRARVLHLDSAIRSSLSASDKVEIPSSFVDFEDWSAKYLSGSIVIHNRALREAKKSNFEDVSLAYRTLLMLRDHYVPMRRQGGVELKRAYDEECKKLGLDESACFGGARAGQEGEAYFINFAGKRCELDRHLKGSNARDERYGFRLYFLWDDDSEQVIVGWFPSHLPTDLT